MWNTIYNKMLNYANVALLLSTISVSDTKMENETQLITDQPWTTS